MSDERASFGNILDRMGVTPTLDEGDLIVDIVVVSRVIAADGTERLSTAWNEGQSWVTRRGMLTCAQTVDADSDTWGEDD